MTRREIRREPDLSAPEYPLPEKMVLIIVRDEGRDDLFIVTRDNFDSPEINALTKQVQDFEQRLEDQSNMLDQRADSVPSRRQRDGRPLSKSQRREIYDALKRSQNPLDEKIAQCYDFILKTIDLESEAPSPGHTLVVTRREGLVVEIEYNPQGEREWWKFVTTPRAEDVSPSEAWILYKRDPNAFLLLHDAFIKGFKYKLAKGEPVRKEEQARAEFDQVRKILTGLADEEFERLSPALQKMMKVIGL